MAKLPPPRRPLPPPRPSTPGHAPMGGGAPSYGAAAAPIPPPAPSGPAAVGQPSEEEYILPQTFFVGRYRVVDEIGVGGMASVHLARVDGPGGFQKWVAIKRIHPHLVEDDQFVDMFLDEARIAAGINHANVAQVFDLGKDESTYWIAMEYLHGEPLRELMRRLDEQGQIIPFTLAARLVADAAEGLHGAHELRGRNGQLLNLVHRDVTPHNLFVTYDGYTKVVDFGIAKVVDRLASTRAGTLKGKLAYMSPEQVRGQEVDRRTDIFALGVVLWELTTNRRLFRMDTDLDTLEKVQACIVPLPSHIVPGYPRDLEEVVMHALAQRPEDRYQTAREFSRALQGFLMRQGTFIGPEDVGEYMKRLFEDRVETREKYLEWAAEVTSTIDVDQLRARQEASTSGVQAALPAADPSQSHLRAPQPPPGQIAVPQMAPPAPVGEPLPDLASTSLMDEDEDIPTRVATKEEEELLPGRAPVAPYASAAGGVARYQRTQQTEALESWPGQRAPAAQPPPDDEDMNATIALPDSRQAAEIRREIAAREQQRAAGYGGGFQQGPPPTQPAPTPSAPVYTPQPAQRFPPTAALPAMQAPQPQPPPQPQPTPQARPHQPQFAPPPQVAPPPQAAPPAQPPGGYQGPGGALQPPDSGGQQSHIETKMSMPRPAAVSQWIAEQGSLENPGPRSTPVLMAIALLSTLCVIGVGALVAYKIRVGDTAARAQVSATPTVSYEPLEPESASSAAPSSTGSDESSTAAAGTAQPTGALPSTTHGGPPIPRGTGTAPTHTATATREDEAEPGFLTVFCNPACDSVVAGGRSLGASPVVNASMPPGQHRVTLKRSGGPTKVISVIIVSGQVTSQRVSMK